MINLLIEEGETVYDNYSKAWDNLGTLTEYLEHHASDHPNDAVEDEDLNALGYKTYEQIKDDIPRLDALAAHYLGKWHETLQMINRTRAMTASDRKLLDDTSDSESNEDKLLADK